MFWILRNGWLPSKLSSTHGSQVKQPILCTWILLKRSSRNSMPGASLRYDDRCFVFKKDFSLMLNYQRYIPHSSSNTIIIAYGTRQHSALKSQQYCYKATHNLMLSSHNSSLLIRGNVLYVEIYSPNKYFITAFHFLQAELPEQHCSGNWYLFRKLSSFWICENWETVFLKLYFVIIHILGRIKIFKWYGKLSTTMYLFYRI